MEASNFGCLTRVCQRLKALPSKSNALIKEIARNTKQVGQEDPRRVYHSLKMGLALTLISWLYYFQPTYNAFGDNLIWAVLTVSLVLEFSVGKITCCNYFSNK